MATIDDSTPIPVLRMQSEQLDFTQTLCTVPEDLFRTISLAGHAHLSPSAHPDKVYPQTRRPTCRNLFDSPANGSAHFIGVDLAVDGTTRRYLVEVYWLLSIA